MVIRILCVGMGGFLGAILRYALSGQVQHWSKSIDFPYGTLVVNILGCLMIGLLSYLSETRGFFSAEVRLCVFIGILGSFTTYSTFSNEAMTLLGDGKHLAALTYIGAHLFLGLGAVWLGHVIAWQIWR